MGFLNHHDVSVQFGSDHDDFNGLNGSFVISFGVLLFSPSSWLVGWLVSSLVG